MIETFNQRLARLRNEHGLNKSQLARELTRLTGKVSRESICKWETGQTQNLRHHNLMGLAKLYGISIEDLFRGTDKTPGSMGVQHEIVPEEKIIDSKGQKSGGDADLNDKYDATTDATRAVIDWILDNPDSAQTLLRLARQLAAIGAESQNQAGAERPADDKWRGSQFTPGKVIQNEEHAGEASKGKQRP